MLAVAGWQGGDCVTEGGGEELGWGRGDGAAEWSDLRGMGEA